MDKQNALDLISQLNDFADKLYENGKDHWINCRETIAWILILLGDSTQKAEGKHILATIFEYKGMSEATRSEVKDNYCWVALSSPHIIELTEAECL